MVNHFVHFDAFKSDNGIHNYTYEILRLLSLAQF